MTRGLIHLCRLMLTCHNGLITLCRFCNEPFRRIYCFVMATSEHGMISTGRRSSPTISMKISSM